ncbi:MAG: thioesterase family protein [Bacteroidetes bacterium]|nr:thioesterase family protein [Bacteroidota bacterium]
MASYIVRWADVDANRHLRHSAYADFGAQTRVLALEQIGLSFNEMAKLKIGPILFREELIYRKEVPMNDKITVSCTLQKARRDASRWSMRHQIYRSDGQLAAIINVDGAWLDLKMRKLTTLSDEVVEKFNLIPRSSDFYWEE